MDGTDSETASVINESKTASVINKSKRDSNEETSINKSKSDDMGSDTTSYDFLQIHPVSQYSKLFIDHRIDLELSLTLTDDDLCGIGITNAEDRRLWLNGIARFNPSQLKSPLSTLELSSNEVGRMLNNTLSHLFLIDAALSHTRCQLSRPGVHNTLLNLQMSSAHLLNLLSSEALIQAKYLKNQLAALLNKKPGAAEKCKQQNRKMRTLGLITMLMTFAGLGYCIYRRL